MARQMHVSVFLLLLLLLFAQLYGTRGILAEQSTGVVRELPRKGQGASQAYTVSTTDRKFIRIHASTEDLTKGKYCSGWGDPIPDFTGSVIRCPHWYVLTENMKAALKGTILPAAIKLHADRVLVDRVSSPLKVPEFKEDSICKNFTVPEHHRNEGVNDADMVVYVAARPVDPFGVPCAYDENSGRPVAGAINVQLYPLKVQRYNVRRIAHEIAHALGFDYQLFVKKNMVSEVTLGGERKRVVVNSSQTKKKAREYYDCNNLDGLELGFLFNSNEISSHWAWRNANDDLMSSGYRFGAMHYSVLTMSVFEDLNFYTVNWGMAESITWGNKTGCEFFGSECKDEDDTKYPREFCSRKGIDLSCTADRLGLAGCDPYAEDRYPNEDYTRCMVRAHGLMVTEDQLHSLLCSETPTFDLSGSITADDSLCLDAEEYNITVEERGEVSKFATNGVCARVSCDKGKVKVMYAGISEWQECPEGRTMEVKRSDSDTPITLKCPKYSEVCTIAPDGSSRLPLVIPPGEKPETIPSLPQAAPTPPAPTAHPPKPDPVQGKGSTQPTTRTTGTDRRNTDIHSGTVPSQSVEKSASTESGNKGRQKRDNTNAAGSANENTDASSSSSSSSSSLPSGSHPIGGTNTADSATTAISLSKEGPPSPQAPGEINLRLGTDGTPAAAYVLHVVFLIMAVALAVPL
ncbi:Peptidase M8 [Trypanosoma melophagium]|uniref:Peptidase M8 n=1 Tax=Trypanosoma melophagium TaxID=715481 RepID=UPI00351A1DEB|nr:Peptidase M8 [Trypanosoma melophagium]